METFRKVVFGVVLSIFAVSSVFASGENDVEPSNDGKISGELVVFLETSESKMRIVNEAFTKMYPDVDLVYSSANATEYETILKTRLAAGDAPDLMTFWPNARTADPAKRGLIKDLTETAYAQRVVDSLKPEVSYAGSIWGIPTSGVGEGLWINRTMFEEQGLALPTNWNEFIEVCESFKNAGIQPISAGFRDDWTIMRFTNTAFATLGYGRDPDYEEKLICEKEDFSYNGWVETFDKLIQLVESGYFGENPLSSSADQGRAKFTQGDAAMWIMGTWDSQAIREGMDEDFDLVFTALPVNKPGEELYGNWRVGNLMSISSSTKNWAAANAYLEVFSDPEIHAQSAVANRDYPVFSDVQVPAIDAATDEFVEDYVITGMAMPGAHYKWPSGMSNNWKKKLQEIVGGDITTDEMIEWLNSEYASMEKQYECVE